MSTDIAKDCLPLPRENITADEKAAFMRGIEAGLKPIQSAQLAGLPVKSTRQLLDLLSDPVVQSAVSLAVHKEIVTVGKALAWEVARDLMQDDKVSASVRWSAARWTLEAAGEGIGQTRKDAGNSKELHEMTEEELQRLVANARTVVSAAAKPADSPLNQEALDWVEQ